jgi:NAD(P)-dependent dehydrogenase (short-subunit alcohol dehydrogenase family)
MAAMKTIVLITGGTSSSDAIIVTSKQARTNKLLIKGNGGIGFELASQLLSDSSKHVLLGSRSIEKGEAAVKDLQSQKQPGTVELLQVDVASDESITAAAKRVESKHGRYAQLDPIILLIPSPSQRLT